MFLISECSCWAGLMFALVILFKLGKQGRSINFINVLFIIIFLYEVILGPFLIHGLFSAAQINWDGETDLENSVAYCRTWYVVYICFFYCNSSCQRYSAYCVMGFGLMFLNTGMIFTR